MIVMTYFSARREVATTTDATPKVLFTLPATISTGTISSEGRIIARNTATNESIVFSAGFAAKITPSTGAIFGSNTAAVYQQDQNMSACTVTASADQTGLIFTGTGIANTDIVWVGNFYSLLEA